MQANVVKKKRAGITREDMTLAEALNCNRILYNVDDSRDMIFKIMARVPSDHPSLNLQRMCFIQRLDFHVDRSSTDNLSRSRAQKMREKDRRNKKNRLEVNDYFG